jgi:hypothetical protein
MNKVGPMLYIFFCYDSLKPFKYSDNDCRKDNLASSDFYKRQRLQSRARVMKVGTMGCQMIAIPECPSFEYCRAVDDCSFCLRLSTGEWWQHVRQMLSWPERW